MDALHLHFLSIVRSALLGQPAADPGDLRHDDCAALAELARIQRVEPLFFEAVYRWPIFRTWEKTPLLHRSVRQQVLTQTLRTAEFTRLNQTLAEAGLAPLVVKGIICRSLYPQPDHRPSGDEDLLIDEEDFPRVHEIFTQFGLRPWGKADSYEVPYRKEGSPLYIELHKHLFPPESEAYGSFNRFFEDAHLRAVTTEIQGVPFRTLEHTDHFLYLILHAFKHFLHSGFGIRQLCDMVLFANRYGGELDWQRIEVSCRSLRAEKFAAALLRIGEIHLGLDPDKACLPEHWRRMPLDPEPMLEDLLEGGLYGDNSMSRKHSSNITLDAAAAGNQGKKPRGGLVSSLFPPADKLRDRYPYLREKPWLLPAAWCSRILTYRSQTRGSRDNTPAQALKIGKTRVQLLKDYDIIP